MRPICAITGSNGYVGGCVKNYFAAHGWEILELTRQPKPNSRAIKFQLGEEISPNELTGVGTFVHCAYDFKPLCWEEIRAVNVEGSRKILEAAHAAKIQKIIFISSISAFDGCKSLYGKAKLEVEKIALTCGALVIRPGLVYGNDSGGMFGKLSAQIKNSSVIPLIGDGSQIQFLVHSEDLCSFIERYARGEMNGAQPQGSQILMAANEQPWPFKKLLLEIARAQNKKIKFVPLPWRVIWLALKSAEVCGLRLNFRSDSLVSLMNQNPAPDFSKNSEVGLICRPFGIEKLQM
jgi:nucleoside-diphosphate-sugar epimerase